MNQADFTKLKVAISKDLEIKTDSVALAKSANVPYIYQKYLDIFIKEVRLHKKLKRDKEKMYKNKYDYYRFSYNHALTAKEIDIFINGDDNYDELCRQYNWSSIIIEYLELTLKNISNLSFNISNRIKLRQFLNGGES